MAVTELRSPSSDGARASSPGPARARLRGRRSQLVEDVELLAPVIGERHDGSDLHHDRLSTAADVIEERFRLDGWTVRRQGFAGAHDRLVFNVEAERRGTLRPDEIVLLGAHYDSFRGCPGANDNGTGVAALLALSRALESPLDRTVRLVAFANEEPPHTRRRTMGSLVYAEAARSRRECIVAMLSLECLGFHARATDVDARSDLTFVQRLFPVWTYGAFTVGSLRSRVVTQRVTEALREASDLPIHRVIAPESLGLAKSSDHWSFWKNGYPALMITDGGPLRYRHYHARTDTPDRIDADALERIAVGVAHAARGLAAQPASRRE